MTTRVVVAVIWLVVAGVVGLGIGSGAATWLDHSFAPVQSSLQNGGQR
jgi:hypothetical protein